MLGDDASARDVVQESFARALEALDRTRPELRFRAWIFRIATNLCLRLLTRQRRRVVPRDDLDRLRDDRGVTDPDRLHHQAELGRRVAAALARLPDRYRQILLLRELEELTYEELAHALAITVDNVKITLHRARARFAVVYMADQLATLAPDRAAEAVACAALAALVAQAARRDAIEGHLRRCERCRGGRQPAAQLLAMLPPVAAPAIPLPPPGVGVDPCGASSSTAASGTATTGSGAALTAMVVAAVVGLALAGTAAGAYLLNKQRTEASRHNTAAAASNASTTSNTAGIRPPSPHQDTQKRATARVVRNPTTSAAGRGSPGSDEGRSLTKTGKSNVRHRRRRPRSATKGEHPSQGRSQQAMDTEDPPRAPPIP
jgi:RNA polymerase sigma-70 factor (ECF subfamily)